MSEPISQRRKRYKLLAGIHVGPDYTQKPIRKENRETGEVTERYPSKTYNRGDVFESEFDLLKLGDEKFALVGQTTDGAHQHPDTFNPGQAQFPAGQVSTGIPQATTGTPGQTIKEPEGPEQLPATPPDLKREQSQGSGAEPKGDRAAENEAAAKEPTKAAPAHPHPAATVRHPEQGRRNK